MATRRLELGFTGGGVTRFPRPWGRSGWVTTAAIRSPRSIRISREGTANSGVPMKTRVGRRSVN